MSTIERATCKPSGIPCPAAEQRPTQLSSRDSSGGLDFGSDVFGDTCTQKPMRIIGFDVPARPGHESPTSVLLQGGDQKQQLPTNDKMGSDRQALTTPRSWLAEELKRNPSGSQVDVTGGQCELQKRLPKLKLQKSRR
eukprot:jgi/Picre1/29137/NNA_004530.t1